MVSFSFFRTFIHLVALAMTLTLAAITGHWFWWVLTGFNLWVALCWLVLIVGRHSVWADGNQPPNDNKNGSLIRVR